MTGSELMQYITEWNRKADKAEADGHYVCEGIVYKQKPKPWEFAEQICKVSDYE